MLYVCPLCNRTPDRVLSSDLRRGVGTVFHCSECDLGFLVTEPRDDKAHYAGDYREHASHRSEGGPTNAKEIFDTYSQYQGDRLKLVSPFIKPDSKVLEIGASSGQFLVHLGSRVRDRFAIELDPACCLRLRKMGINADFLPLRESNLSLGKYDLVCAFQTMEHVEDPVGFLTDIHLVMARGAVAVVEVPNLKDALLSAWGLEEYRRFYFHADHRFYFTETSLRIVAKRAGFEKVRVHYSQDYNLVSTINWIMNRVPQPTCHPGLSRVKFEGRDAELAKWLTTRMSLLSDEYADLLAKTGRTSNITLILS